MEDMWDHGPKAGETGHKGYLESWWRCLWTVC